ncbi:SGNH/GDSL hydrolase family protein [Leuconostoc mesenteroides]|uniref:SGNH/GDSL hydrolase family protein n=1 Tax=Leuconostoc mesenteroides TaxID=1245 RepID=UPI001CBBFF26|nr:SGNH/GDSL hydrolase family protein [Leuconostoc mesenteroides]MBZ1515943.1 SGNH/GDSL hydrolase family protein [Leuconostoc mesenteroides]MBZ1517631.1 SGNH/GDSL hydrolase family protein [Leuconostoc mesenteroides]MBZ1520340.1 SGNH/GDSL hydrolase family protein [Leuconostoc mesenteroides]
MDKLITNLDTNLGPVLREQLDTNFQKIQNGVDGQSDTLNKQIEAMLGTVPLQDKNEVTQARIDDNNVVYSTLKGRLDVDQTTAETALKEERLTGIEVQSARSNSSGKSYDTLKARLDDEEANLTNNMNAKIAQISSVPETFANLSALQATYPNGKTGLFVTADTGHKFIWANGGWSDAGFYQAVGDNLVSGEINYANPNVAPFNDLDTLPLNKIVTYATSEIKNVAHAPSGLSKNLNGATVYTLSNDSNLAGSVQYFVGEDNVTYSRIAWGDPAHYSGWKTAALGGKMIGVQTGAPYDDLNTFPMNQTVVIAETPQTIGQIKHLPNIGPNVGGLNVTSHSWSDRSIGGVQIAIDTDNVMHHRIAWGSDNNWGAWRSDTPDQTYLYPMLSLFEKVGVIGDSYASGELAFDGNNIDHYEISWLQQLARKNGFVGTNFSYGGSQTRHWLLADKGLNLLNTSEPQELYVLALGINDISLGLDYLGVEADIDTGSDTFYGNYGKIIKAVQVKAPNAKLVMSTVAGYDSVKDQFNAAIANIANHFGIPFIVLNEERFFLSTFYQNNLVGGHPTAPVYSAMASAYERMLDKVMYSRYDYFSTYKKQ